MLYKKNSEKSLSRELFQNPSSEYRAAPFWAWNNRLEKETLKKQIKFFKQMGFGGFHMHSRTGMSTEYLSEDFFSLISFCVEEAEKNGLLAWAYDEDRWPSGSAGGLVTKDIKHRGKKLVFTTLKNDSAEERTSAQISGAPYLLAVYDVVLNEEGYLESYKIISEDEKTLGQKRYAYILTNEKNPWFNNQAYVDTLSKEAMDKFIELTYEGYKNAVGDKFGGSVPAMFTDEPQFALRTFLRFSDSDDEAEIPWTTGFENIFEEHKGYNLREFIPELFWEKADGELSFVRYDFTDTVSELFCKSFMDNCGAWCKKNGILFTGHMMLEPTLELQSWGVGDVMRA